MVETAFEIFSLFIVVAMFAKFAWMAYAYIFRPDLFKGFEGPASVWDEPITKETKD
jgi:hypothetical protein